jgi:hypothetical protein
VKTLGRENTIEGGENTVKAKPEGTGTGTTLFKKQKAAIRIVCQEKHFAHTKPLSKSLLILPLPTLVEFFKLQFMQQYVRGLLLVALDY